MTEKIKTCNVKWRRSQSTGDLLLLALYYV